MSDINDADDLLNCELLGELDDHALLGDEDDLLLSDEEVDKSDSRKKNDGKSAKSNEIKLKENRKHIENKTTAKSNNGASKIAEKIQNKSAENATESADTIIVNNKPEVTVSTTEELNSKETKANKIMCAQKDDISKSQNDEVSSTNKEFKAVENQSQAENDFQEASNLEELNYEPDVRDEDNEDNPGERLNIKQASERDDVAGSSPDKNLPNQRFPYAKRGGRGRGSGPPFMPRNHMQNMRPPFNNRHQMGNMDNSNTQQGMMQGQYQPNAYSNEMQGQMLSRQPFPPNHMMKPRMDFQHHRPIGPNFISNPNENIMGPRMYGQRHPPPNGMMPPYNNAPQPGNMMRPMYRPSDPGQLRPRMLLRPQAPMPLGLQNNPNFSSQPSQMSQSHLIPSNIRGNTQQNISPNPPVLPRKVHINPNFKGGVEAATSQLMKDTQFIQTISSHVSHLQSEEELLRQQEEFIKKNQLQIDKRRFARSPGRSRTRSRTRSRSRGRVRSRERSYSPPRRREFHRERRGGGGGLRGIGLRSRRANSREWESDRRRRSFTPDRKDKEKTNEEEDEETRAYRLEIEKQKAMREKILKDKELRRRKAAEDKLGEDKVEEPQKLKPIVVTESKIISLKKIKEIETASNNKGQKSVPSNIKKSSAISTTKPMSAGNSPQRGIKRALPTAKILPDAKRTLTEHLKKEIVVSTTSGKSGAVKSNAQSTTSSTTAIVKPVLKKSATVQTESAKTLQQQKQKNSSTPDDVLEDYDDELLEEERLLASPTPSPSNTPELEDDDDDFVGDSEIHSIGNKTSDDNEDFVDEELKKPKKSSFMSSNRKVLLKPFHSNNNKSDDLSAKKRVFDRLENPKQQRKVVGVKESAKKRIQRIIE